jgi:hypothetical protein
MAGVRGRGRVRIAKITAATTIRTKATNIDERVRHRYALYLWDRRSSWS